MGNLLYLEKGLFVFLAKLAKSTHTARDSLSEDVTFMKSRVSNPIKVYMAGMWEAGLGCINGVDKPEERTSQN